MFEFTGRPGPFCVVFVFSTHVCVGSGFLPQSKNIYVMLISNSKSVKGVNLNGYLSSVLDSIDWRPVQGVSLTLWQLVYAPANHDPELDKQKKNRRIDFPLSLTGTSSLCLHPETVQTAPKYQWWPKLWAGLIWGCGQRFCFRCQAKKIMGHGKLICYEILHTIFGCDCRWRYF